MIKKAGLIASIFLVVSISFDSYAMEAVKELSSSFQATGATLKLIDGIKEARVIQVKEAVAEGADINFHNTVTDEDLGVTDWTPLMEAVGQLKSVLVAAQSAINTAGWFGGWLGAGAAGRVKERYKDEINALCEIIELLLADARLKPDYTDHKGRSAATLCAGCYDLLHSKTLCPSYKARLPEKEYVDKLYKISSLLPPAAPLAERSQATANCISFCQETLFEIVNPQKPPIVFHSEYDIRAYGFQKLHDFDTEKYGKIAAVLKQSFVKNFYEPASVSQEDLKRVHTDDYLASLDSSLTLALIAKFNVLSYCSNSFAQSAILEPVKLATGGTILAAQLALKYGWAINLSGGYHHAKSDKPVVGGFCFINDSLVAAQKVLAERPNYRVLIVDLGAHQGNGNAEIAEKDGRIGLFDMYNKDTWPGDVQKRINFDYPLPAGTKYAEYLTMVKAELPKAINRVRPNLIIYNAGTDLLEGDLRGAFSLTKGAIIERDEFVFTQALERRIPILMVLSGGYHPTEGINTITESITNLWNKLLSSTCKKSVTIPAGDYR